MANSKTIIANKVYEYTIVSTNFMNPQAPSSTCTKFSDLWVYKICRLHCVIYNVMIFSGLTVTIVSSPDGTQVSGSTNTFDYPICDWICEKGSYTNAQL